MRSRLARRDSLESEKGDGRGFNNTGEMRWSERSRLYSSERTDRPSITPGRSADEAWAPAREKKVQTDRRRRAGRGEVGKGQMVGVSHSASLQPPL